jgi:pyruvate formate-lyase/glycerol dehydratase family glycyl radical enzyme
MAIELGDKKTKDVGSWQELFVPTCSQRVQKAKNRALKTPEICLERARAEMKAYEQYQNEPRIIQRARVLETHLREKTIFILEDELIVGNITSKVRGSQISGEVMAHFMDEELDDPVKDFEVRPYDKHLVLPEERRELRQVLLPYFKGKTLGDYNLKRADAEVREKAYPSTSSCPHIPNVGDVSMERDVGHQMANYEKVLHKGLKGIREEVEWYMAQLDQPYMHYGVPEKRDFYKAVLITLDAAIAYARRYADLARDMAAKEADPKRQQELERIARVCHRVPANPARDWWEALQSVWMMHVLVYCELSGGVHCFGRFDQYTYPFYKKSVIDKKTMSREEALELLECFWIKTNELAELRCYENSMYTTGQSLSQALVIGGQTRDGKDACNEVTMLCLETEEQVGVIQPETAMRIWEGTPDKYLKKAAEVIRLGRGKPKFFGDRKGIQMVSKAYPDRTIEDHRDYAVLGCTETVLPYITMGHLYEGVSSAPKLLELVLNNGRCALCGQQVGPLTGDPRTFESMAAVRQAFREQVCYWMEYLVKGIKVLKEGQACRLPAPFCSSLSEGPLPKGLDIVQGGAWYTNYGLFLAGVADTADSLAVIDKLIYRDKKITWEQLLEAIKANWKGYESLRQLCLNGVPKYGNDNDFADDWAAWVMDTWYDSVDWINTRKDLVPDGGGMYIGATNIAVINVMLGDMVGALPNGHIYPKPQAETLSPVQGMDKNGPTAVIKSVSKLPTHRFALGGAVNLRLSPQLVATDRDLDNFVSFLRAIEELGLYHIQFNVVSSDLLRKAMKEPENYRELMVRVASYCAYFVELTEEQQLDIVNRTEQQGW